MSTYKNFYFSYLSGIVDCHKSKQKAAEEGVDCRDRYKITMRAGFICPWWLGHHLHKQEHNISIYNEEAVEEM